MSRRGHRLVRLAPADFTGESAWGCACGHEYGRCRGEKARALHREHVAALPPKPPKLKPEPIQMVHPGATLLESKQWLTEHLRDYAKCPCCSQIAMAYQRRLSNRHARMLLAMYQQAGKEWVDITEISRKIKGGRDEAFLQYWHLIQEAPDQRPDGGRIGWWRVTDKGERFIRGEITIPAVCNVYDGRPVRDVLGRWPMYEGPSRTFIEIYMGRGFKFNELMGIPF